MIDYSVCVEMECTCISTIQSYYVKEFGEVQRFRECCFKGFRSHVFNIRVPESIRVEVGKSYYLVFRNVICEDGESHTIIEVLE